MDPKDIRAALEAIKTEDTASALAILEAMLIKAAGGSAEEAPAEEASAEPMAETPPADEDEEKEEAAAMAATARELLTLSGRSTHGEALEDVKAWRSAYIAAEESRKTLANERKALEATERRVLVAQLVKLGAETPATAWARDQKGMPTSKPCKRLEGEPIADLRERVAMLSASKGKAAEIKPPIKTDSLGLSDREIAMCAEMKVDPKEYAAQKAANSKKA